VGADDGVGAASAVASAKAGVATAVLAEAAASRSPDRARGKATAPAIKSVNETPRAIAPDFRGRFGPGADPGSFPNFDNVPPVKRPGNSRAFCLSRFDYGWSLFAKMRAEAGIRTNLRQL
jgi:hypothetical protein